MEKLRKTEKPESRDAALRRRQSEEVSNFALRHENIVTYLEALLKDCYNKLSLYGYVDYVRDLETIRTRFAHEGISFATNTLPSFFDSVLSYLESGVSEFPSFKIRRGVAYPEFLQGITSQIFEHPTEPDTVIYIQSLYQLCVAFKKLRGPYRQEVLDEQLAKFIKVDKELVNSGSLEDGVFIDKILDVARDIVTEVMSGLNPFDPQQAESFKPRPGPGATNTPTKPHERFRANMEYLNLHKSFKIREWFNPPLVSPQINRWDLRIGASHIRPSKVRNVPTSRFEFVPKTFSKARGICIEELEMQYLQQGLRKAMCDRIEVHPLTRGYVNFTHQTINAELALQASLDRVNGTIDCSDASDRISRALVHRLFSGNPELCEALMLCSTRIIMLPDGRKLHANKFAPMGSAICFPVMGLVHFALIRSLALFFSPPWVQIPEVYVYGDDIIVNRELALKVFKFLPMFGMKLNKSKSFINSHFRESCGMNAYLGVDITPTRFKSLVKFPPNSEELVSALVNESDLFYKGFTETASLIRCEILRVKAFGASSFPRVHRESGLLGWIREDYDAFALQNAKRRWNSKFSRFEYKVLVVEQITEKPPLLNDREGYLRWLLLDIREADARHTGGLPHGLQIRRKWLPSSAEYTPIIHPFKRRIEGWIVSKN